MDCLYQTWITQRTRRHNPTLIVPFGCRRMFPRRREKCRKKLCSFESPRAGDVTGEGTLRTYVLPSHSAEQGATLHNTTGHAVQAAAGYPKLAKGRATQATAGYPAIARGRATMAAMGVLVKKIASCLQQQHRRRSMREDWRQVCLLNPELIAKNKQQLVDQALGRVVQHPKQLVGHILQKLVRVMQRSTQLVGQTL
jgi:hypothetical protein